MTIEGYTEAELAMLSDEERAALEDSSEEERAALNAVVNDGDDDGDGKGDDDAGAAGDDKGDDAAGKGGSDDDDDDDGQRHFVPKYQAEPVADYDEQITALDKRFEDGEIDLKAYNTEREGLLRRQLKAEIAAEQQEQNERQLWEYEINSFLDDHKEYRDNRLLHAALDAAVRELGNDEANADKSFRWFLREADKQVKTAFGRTENKEPKPGDEGDKGGDQAKAGDDKGKGGRKPDLSVVPKTLGNVPAAGDNADDGEFAYLDKLSGVEYERAIARLSDDQRSRYMAA